MDNFPFKLGQFVYDICGGYYEISLEVTSKETVSAVKQGETYQAIRFRPSTKTFCIDFNNGFVGWYGEERFTYEDKREHKCKLVLYHLKNGMSRLESVLLDEPPSDKLVQSVVELYGAESYSIQQITIG